MKRQIICPNCKTKLEVELQDDAATGATCATTCPECQHDFAFTIDDTTEDPTEQASASDSTPQAASRNSANSAYYYCDDDDDDFGYDTDEDDTGGADSFGYGSSQPDQLDPNSVNTTLNAATLNTLAGSPIPPGAPTWSAA
ncbi:MAG: hypothetical protein LBL67_04225 [Coriobacteriales bacterium]|jgi:hypothetical protein|nr:hypothetical protein [Coriobacteriales bacterium]